MMNSTGPDRRSHNSRRMAWVAIAATFAAVTCSQSLFAQDADIVPPAPTPEDTSAEKQESMNDSTPAIQSQTQRQSAKTVDFDGWKMEIRPKQSSTEDSSNVVASSRYQEIYQSIPFSRAEYLANPSYRHDTTVELMFGEMRPTVINRTSAPETIKNARPQPYEPRLFRELEYWRYPGRFISLFPGFGPMVSPIY